MNNTFSSTKCFFCFCFFLCFLLFIIVSQWTFTSLIIPKIYSNLSLIFSSNSTTRKCFYSEKNDKNWEKISTFLFFLFHFFSSFFREKLVKTIFPNNPLLLGKFRPNNFPLLFLFFSTKGKNFPEKNFSFFNFFFVIERIEENRTF